MRLEPSSRQLADPGVASRVASQPVHNARNEY